MLFQYYVNFSSHHFQTTSFVINFDNLDKDRMNKSIDNIIHKLSFISLKKFMKEEDDIIDELKMMLNGKSIGNISKNLLDIYERLENILNEESKKYINK